MVYEKLSWRNCKCPVDLGEPGQIVLLKFHPSKNPENHQTSDNIVWSEKFFFSSSTLFLMWPIPCVLFTLFDVQSSGDTICQYSTLHFDSWLDQLNCCVYTSSRDIAWICGTLSWRYWLLHPVYHASSLSSAKSSAGETDSLQHSFRCSENFSHFTSPKLDFWRLNICNINRHQSSTLRVVRLSYPT